MKNIEKTIVKVGNAHIEGYEGAFLFEKDEDGKDLVTGLCGEYYEASGADSDGNDYTVFWQIINENYKTEEDESWNCDWNNPWMIVDSEGKNVTDKVILD